MFKLNVALGLEYAEWAGDSETDLSYESGSSAYTSEWDSDRDLSYESPPERLHWNGTRTRRLATTTVLRVMPNRRGYTTAVRNFSRDTE